MPVIGRIFGEGRGCAVTELRHLSLCHCVTVCVCPLHAAQGLATSRTVPRHPAGAPHVMDCYLCGREFDTRILNNHEDECIKHWRKWNNSLPLDQRQPEPERPEFKFNKGHLCILTYACVCEAWSQRLLYLLLQTCSWADFRLKCETTARLSFHGLTFAHEWRNRLGSGGYLRESLPRMTRHWQYYALLRFPSGCI